MLRNVKGLHGCRIHATDGDIGHIEQLYFDDAHWTVRYLVIDTGHWLPGRKVLISPYALGEADWRGRRLHVQLTRDQVESSPDIDTEKPVSRQHEIQYSGHFGWPYWWVGPGLWGPMMYPGLIPPAPEIAVDEQHAGTLLTEIETGGDPHLRSTEEVIGSGIHARDGEIGHAEDFLFDDASWEIRYLVVDTGSWWPGKKVLLPPRWIQAVDWPKRSLTVDLPREAIRGAPEWDPHTPITSAYEEQLYRHYGRAMPVAPPE